MARAARVTRRSATGRAAPAAAGPAIDSAGPAPDPAAQLQGFIDQIVPGRISGWAWDPQQPKRRVLLDLLAGDTRLAQGVADQFRADLRTAGIGDGQHAFLIRLSEDLLAAGPNILDLRCTDTGARVPGSPIMVMRAAGLSSDALAPPAAVAPFAANGDGGVDLSAGIEESAAALTAVVDNALQLEAPLQLPQIEAVLQSHVDFADWTGVKGWSWDPAAPHRRVALDLLDGETVLATVTASEYRPDLEEFGIGDGRHGFSITFNASLLPYARHELHLRPVGSMSELPPFPLLLTRDGVGLDPSVEFLLGNIAAEVERAENAEQLSPILSMLVGFLDGALARYFEIAEDAAASPTDLLNPLEFAPQLRTLVESVQWSYPVLALGGDRDPMVSIIIPVFNKFDLTYACIKSIIECGAELPIEIIVVDDCSRDETLLASFAFGKGIRLVRNAVNGGFIRSCNAGAAVARGQYLVFLNNDTEVKPRWLDELYETLLRDPKIGIAGSKLLFPDGSLQECGGIIWRLGDGWNWGRNEAADDPRFCYMRDADYVSGAALMIKARLFAELGQFDEHFLPAYYEDTDLCFRTRQKGYRVVVQPASEIVHFEGASAGTSTTGSGMKRFQPINHRKFFDRWKDVLATHRFNGELPELEAERSVRQRALFIDDSVPEPDKDAGSNAAFQHMLSLQRLGYKVTFVPADNMAKIDPYTLDLQRRGIECLYHPYYFSVEDLLRKKPTSFDLVYLHRYSNASKYGGMIRQHFPRARIVYNVADLHFLRLQREAEVKNDAALRQEAEQLRRLELGAMSFVDCVIVHSSVEAELLQQVAPGFSVRVIPWTIEPREIVHKANGKAEIAFIGGFRHPPNADAAKWAAQSIMPLLREQVPGLELLLVGSNMPAEVSSLAAKDVVPVGYVPSLDTVFERVRLTVAPLRYGAGLKGKVLESFAAGVPCVMTTVAAEGVELPETLRWLVADEPAGLAERIATLCRDDTRYRRLAAACKAHVAANFSAERIDALIREACGSD
jgi:GT2 family glycosyltransferase/glycosyltransferase involved in cell wall biosynthesis